jgi:hypothetical protein
MGISDLGITKADFEDNAFSDFARTVVRTPITKTTSNSTGSPTFSSGTTSSIQSIFTRRNQNFDWAKEGLFEAGDAFMQFKEDQTMNKDDWITVGGEKFRVDTIILRQAGGNSMFKSCNLFLID